MDLPTFICLRILGVHHPSVRGSQVTSTSVDVVLHAAGGWPTSMTRVLCPSLTIIAILP